MNELMIVFGSSFLYFKTNETEASKAFSCFCETCDNAGINIDNMQITKIVLRDADQNDIDKMSA